MKNKLLKKIRAAISSLLVFAILFSNLAFFPLTEVKAAGEVLTIGSLSADYGDNIVVPLMATNFSDIMGMTFYINYDSSALTYDGYTETATVGNPTLSVNEFGGVISVNWIGTTPIDVASGSVLDLKFVVASSSPTTSNITFSNTPNPPEIADSIGDPVFSASYVNGVVTLNAGAANQGDVIINEVFPNPTNPTGVEWYELLNTTSTDIDLTGWTIARSATSDTITLSGTLPKNGILVFSKDTGSVANNGGDFLQVKQGANIVFALSYGLVILGSEPHGVAPNADEVLYVSNYGPSLTYSTSATHTKGWFNNAIDWTCNQLAGTGSPSVPPTLSSVAACLASENSVLTNMPGSGATPNPSQATNIFFAKVRDTGGLPDDFSNLLGKITFAGPINLTNKDTVDYLKGIGNKLQFESSASYSKVGLNTYLVGNAESVFKNLSATIVMAGLDAYDSAPTLVVKDNTGSVIAPASPSYPTISGAVFDNDNKTYTFNTNHFTSFETVDTGSPSASISYSKDGGVTYTSELIRVRDADTLRIKATFSEPMADSPVTKIAIDNGVLVATDMTKINTTNYYYDLNVPSGDVASALVSLSIGEDLSGNVITSTPTSGGSFVIDNTLPVLAEVTPVTTPTEDNTPSYTFSTTEAGTITYGGDCLSSEEDAVVGNNTITFNTLAAGTHSNCTITVTDQAGNPSSPLTVTAFTITIPAPGFSNQYVIATSVTEVDAAIDASGNIYSAYVSGGNVYLKKNRGNAELVSAGSTPSVVVDSDGDVYVAYSNSGLYYKKRTDGVWGDAVLIGSGSEIDIDVDSNGYVHATYMNTDQYADVMYSNNTSGSFVTSLIYDGYYWYDGGSRNASYYNNPSIKVDGNGKYHIATVNHYINGGMGWTDHDYSIVYTNNAGLPDTGSGGFGNNASVAMSNNPIALDAGGNPIIFYSASSVVYAFPKTNMGAGSNPSIFFGGGKRALSYINTTVKYKENTGDGFSEATDLGNGSIAIPLLGSRHVLILNGSDLRLETSETILESSTPVVTGVSDGGVYSNAVTPLFGATHTATLNGNPFVSGTSVSSTGNYVLIVTNEAETASVTINFSIDATGPTFTVNEGTDAGPVKTDIINITVSDPNGVDASSVEYGFSANNVCDNTDTYGNAFTSGTNFSISGNHTDYLCVTAADNGGNTSYQLVGQLNTDNTAPTTQDTAFATSTVKKGGVAVTIVSAGENGGAVWFAPAATTEFSAGATMTTAGGTATSILAPATAGAYRLFVIDAAGNVSAASTAILTVDNTAPTNQNTVFPSNVVTQGGATVTIVSAGENGGAVWFAPAATTEFSAGATMTTAGGTATSILAPATTGDYKLFIIDEAGNISAASIATLSVDATGPTFTINEGTDAGPVKTDVINITVSDPNGVDASSVEYGFSANNVCDNTDTYGNAFTSGTNFSISGNHTDYLCVTAADNGGNTSYQLVGQLNTDNTAPTTQDTAFATSTVKKGGVAVTIVSAGENGGAVWFAPAATTEFSAGATMTTAGGTATSILAPATAGAYRLFVIDAAGNVSAASTAILTVDNTAPTNQNTVFPSNVVTQGGATVTIVSAGENGGAVWFAPAATTEFSAGATMTTAGGTATSILAPATTGDYKLFIIDEAGNISAASIATLSVDATGPTFTINEGTDAGPVKTDVINITVSDPNGVDASSVEYGFSANNVCDNTDTYGNAFTSGTNFSISGNHTDYLCVTAADNGGNTSYQLVGQLNTDNTAPTTQDTAFATSTVKKGGVAVTIVSAGENGGAVWFAPAATTEFSAGATMTTAGGTATSILAPATAGAYRLFVIDAAGNVSAASTAILTVDNTAPTNQNTVFPSNVVTQGGATVTIVSAGENGGAVWFAPAATTEFSAGATMTTAGGTATSILAPATAGAYRLFVIDAAGNVSAASTAILTVDNTAPTNQNTVFPSNVVTQGGATVTIVSAGENGGAVWFAPAATTEFSAGATMTTAGGTATSILAPATTGDYKLFIIDEAGNISAASIATLSVDATGPTFTINEGTDAGPVKTDVINITVSDPNGVDASSVEYGFSANNVCDNTDTYGNAFTSGTNFSISGNHTDYLCVTAADNGGNTSYQLVGQLNTDNTAPTTQDTAFATSTVKKGGVAVTIVSAGENGGAVWFAPAATTEFSAGATMTTASGTATSILSPATAGAYRLFVIDAAGNVSAASTAILTVDNTAPNTPVITSVAGNNMINQAEANAIIILGTAEVGSVINISLTDGATPTPNTVSGSTTADGAGNYTANLDGTTLIDGNVVVLVTATDVAGNISNQATVTVTKNTGSLTISNVETQDLNQNGVIDAVKITFNKNILDSTVNIANFDVAGRVGEAFSSTTNGDVANNNVIYITFTESGAFDTAQTPNCTYTQGTLADAFGNALSSGVNTSTDKAPAAVTKVGDDSVDVTIPAAGTILLPFSETLSVAGKTAVENALLAGADKVITFNWVGSNLTVNGHATDITTFANDVMANTTDLLGNSRSILLIDSSITATQVQPSISGNIVINNTTPEGIVVDPSLPITATIAAGTVNPEINVNAFVSNGTGVLPGISIVSNNTNNVNVDIPASTTVTSADANWNGVIAAPTNTVVAIPNATTDTAIQVGFTGAKLSFDKAVRILIPGKAGMRVGYDRADIPFTEIVTVCADDTQATNDLLPVDGDCKINVGGDLVIWTKHFTVFATFTPTSSGGSGGGGGGSAGSVSNPFTGSSISLKINNGDKTTSDRRVILTLEGGNGAKKMAISNSASFVGSVQEVYEITKQWELSSGHGNKTVCVRFYDQNGYFSNPVCADIAYVDSKQTLSKKDIIRQILIILIKKKILAMGIK
ncbi:beta strand repeat-containing protein [Minisyncoccus archaeiphilus]|uniref:beta strand repeat-containing protein n=1 Tax=Minisyncoccus archaeiphilus TaxID=3238481 RepID=UPI00399D4960